MGLIKQEDLLAPSWPSSSMDSNRFPTLVISPAVDAQSRWVALLLSTRKPLQRAEFARIYNDSAFVALVALIPCVIEAGLDAFDDFSSSAPWPADQLLLLITPSLACDPAQHSRLDAITKTGIGLMLKGLPPPTCTLPTALKRLAIPCPGHVMPADLTQWLARLPGPHLALGTLEHLCPGRCAFHWLAGHWPGQRPSSAADDPSRRALLLRLLALVVADAEIHEIKALIKRDAHLTYQLLRLVNSAAFAPVRPIDSLAQAITIVGRRQLQRWLQLLLYVQPAGAHGASPLLPLAAFRAAMMEALGRRNGENDDELDRAFLVGMFSLLDRLFAAPLAEILAPLPLSAEIRNALLEHVGILGTRLAAIEAAHLEQHEALEQHLRDLQLDPFAWTISSIDAARWAAQVAKEA